MLPTLLLLAASAQADPPARICHPVLHGGVDRPEGPTVSQARWLAGSEDGQRAALMVSRGEHYRAVLAYTADGRTTSDLDLPPDPPPSIDAHFESLRADTDWLKSVDLDPAHVPEPVPWCQLDGAVVLEDQILDWSLWDEACTEPGSTTRQWRICTRVLGPSDPSCVEAPVLPGPACWTEEPRLVDVFTLGSAIWFVVERPREGSTPRMAGGMRIR